MSVLYEPLRLVFLEHYGLANDVGGVGGVGGLCNLWDEHDGCGTTAGGAEAPYCFRAGVFLGFTPFALVVLLAWTLPVLVGCGGRWLVLHLCATSWGRRGLAAGAEEEVRESTPFPTRQRGEGEVLEQGEQATANAFGSAVEQEMGNNAKHEERRAAWLLGLFTKVWISLTVFWFALPLLQYETAEFFEKNTFYRVLAFAITAAYPLSWHLSVVALLSAAAAIAKTVSKAGAAVRNIDAGGPYNTHRLLLGMHKFVGWSTVLLAVLHGGGELIWFVYRKEVWMIFDLSDGENLIYLTGLLCFALVLLLAALSWWRHSPAAPLGLGGRVLFQTWHRKVAILLLVTVTAHWWPFAIFLVPTVAIAAVRAWTSTRRVGGRPSSGPDDGRAALDTIRGANTRSAESGSDPLQLHSAESTTSRYTVWEREAKTQYFLQRRVLPSLSSGKAASIAVMGAVIGLSLVWEARNVTMGRRNADTYSAFVFPPLALAAGFAVALALLLQFGETRMNRKRTTTTYAHPLKNEQNEEQTETTAHSGALLNQRV